MFVASVVGLRMQKLICLKLEWQSSSAKIFVAVKVSGTGSVGEAVSVFISR